MCVRGLLVLLILMAGTGAAAQTRDAAYLEIGGSGVLPTLNYERRLGERLAARIGFSFVTGEEEEGTGEDDLTFVLPVVASYITHPQRRHHFEAGGGLLFVVGDSQDIEAGDDDESVSNVAVTGLAGYRYQRREGGFLFRSGITPIYFDGDVVPIIGLSFGWSW